jgi:hypothetical protein
MQSRIASRIERQLGITGPVDALANKLPASDLQSLMLEVYGIRASQVKESSTLSRASRVPLMAPSAVSARELHAFDAIPFAARTKFRLAGPFAGMSVWIEAPLLAGQNIKTR